MARVRVHQHVNPLAPFFRQEPEAIKLDEIFSDASKPLHIDIGCARGRFLLKMADVEPDWNYLGIEIRRALVEEANRLASDADLENLHYIFCNAMLWFGKLIENVPQDIFQRASIQFPDPWFKKKHAKRRMVNAEMVQTLAERLAPNGQVLVQTDIDFLADEMFELFRNNSAFTETQTEANPFPVKTERENAVEEKGLPVYRTIFIKNNSSLDQKIL